MSNRRFFPLLLTTLLSAAACAGDDENPTDANAAASAAGGAGSPGAGATGAGATDAEGTTTAISPSNAGPTGSGSGTNATGAGSNPGSPTDSAAATGSAPAQGGSETDRTNTAGGGTGSTNATGAGADETQTGDNPAGSSGQTDPSGSMEQAGEDATTDDIQGPQDSAASTPSGACSFTITESTSDVIPTVGIVEWTTDVPIDSAQIEFSLDTSYGLNVPVDLTDMNADGAYRSLILGMKHSSEYNFRIVATSGDEQCSSESKTLPTGALPNNLLAEPTVETPRPDELSGGYLISGRWGDNNDGPAFIMDKDNDYVWWYPAPQDVIRARMTYDGKAMWIRNTGQTKGSGVVLRVSMDGLEEERFDLPPTTHDLAVMPDGRLGLTAWDDGSCAEIQIFDPETEATTTIFNAQDAHGSSSCHVNNLQYYAEDDSFTFSDYNQDCFVKIKSSGELVWVLNGPASDFSGTSWQRQHGLHILDANHLMVFSNGNAGQNSIAYELMLDEGAGTAEVLWTYDPGVSAPYGGDVQRLDNGNTLVTFSSAGTIHEVNADGQLVQSMEWPINNTVSYSMKRDSLYGGPPPKVH